MLLSNIVWFKIHDNVANKILRRPCPSLKNLHYHTVMTEEYLSQKMFTYTHNLQSVMVEDLKNTVTIIIKG